MDKKLSGFLRDTINEGSNALKYKLYQQTLAKKDHTLHCLIHKFFEYFMHEYTIWEIDRCKGKFGCHDENIQNATPREFNLKLNETCAFFRQDYMQYEAQASVDLSILEMYRTG